jgi:hypothetical protein
MKANERERCWQWSFFRRAIAFRYLWTPVGTIVVTYSLDSISTVTYRDVYIFGIRIARIQIQI